MAQISGSRRHYSETAKFSVTERRPQNDYPSRPRLRDVYRPVHLAAASETEIWLMELWKDFLLEPTPYLYYPTVLNIAYFLIQLIPWDDDLGAPGHQF
ncbi:hypothetical protein ACHAPF_003205 [Botrytis cinerea]|uniref:Uncharacterized protein n=1 Tax=Botryotinia fuckeliana (strain T4) TaxID=999810 RepID=G2YQK0_BOTF4|nr:hypothetical protein BofuT4_uP130780.1 [Botrytis cinerea T4]